VARRSGVPFRERSRVRAGNYAVYAVFSHTPFYPHIRIQYPQHISAFYRLQHPQINTSAFYPTPLSTVLSTLRSLAALSL